MSSAKIFCGANPFYPSSGVRFDPEGYGVIVIGPSLFKALAEPYKPGFREWSRRVDGKPELELVQAEMGTFTGMVIDENA